MKFWNVGGDSMKFWVVTNYRDMNNPELGDICFLTDVRGIMLQALGGLRPKDVIGVYQYNQAVSAKVHGEEVISSHNEKQQLNKI